MAIHDSVGDFLTQIRNAYNVSLPSCLVRHSRLKEGVLAVLLKFGYVRSYGRVQNGSSSWLDIQLKYLDGQAALCSITRVSRPGRRVYSAHDSLPSVLNGMGVSVVSTSKGIVSSLDARRMKLGGEVICTVY